MAKFDVFWREKENGTMANFGDKCKNCGYFETISDCRWCSLYDMFVEGDGDACDEFENK